MTKSKLTRDDWIAAGFFLLAHQGPASLQIKLLAERLGATKGSFYWHFVDLNEYKDAMLELWKTKVALEVFEEVESASSAEERLDKLFENAARAAPEKYGGRSIEPAMRAWALSDQRVAKALCDLDELRLSFIEEIFSEFGIQERALSALAYGAYIGVDDLSSKGKADINEALEALKKMILHAAR